MNGTFIWLALIVGGLFWVNSKNSDELSQQEILNNKAALAAELATVKKESLPNVTPDNKIPDLKDCDLCDGTGYITHADGHKTPCPYHANTVEIEKLQNSLMNLSESLANQKQYNKDLYQYLRDQETLKPVVTTKLVPNNCPCGCRHTVGECNCRATCPGHKLPEYKTIKTISNPTTKNVTSVSNSTVSSPVMYSEVRHSRGPVRNLICRGRNCGNQSGRIKLRWWRN